MSINKSIIKIEFPDNSVKIFSLNSLDAIIKYYIVDGNKQKVKELKAIYNMFYFMLFILNINESINDK